MLIAFVREIVESTSVAEEPARSEIAPPAAVRQFVELSAVQSLIVDDSRSRSVEAGVIQRAHRES